MSVRADQKPDLYKLLGVTSEATGDEIKKAYRKLAKRYHPDTTGGDKTAEQRFKEISTAYDILGNDSKRAEYDAMRSNPFMGGSGPRGAGPMPQGFDLGDLSLLSELFGQPLGGRGTRGQTPQGFHFDFRQAGGPHSQSNRSTYAGGQRPTSKSEPKERKIRAPDGTVLRQVGGDTHSEVRLAIDRAILGTVVDVMTLTGKAKVKVPPGTSSGAKLRLKNKGAKKADGSRGNHYVTVHIDVPKSLDDEGKHLLTQLMQRVRK